jgi:nucleotide-binding universal stress UspA family protein
MSVNETTKTISLRRVFHATDLSELSRPAFVHAVKLALVNKGLLTVLHASKRKENTSWDEFPGVRETLRAWGLLPESDSQVSELHKLGIEVQKVIGTQNDPVESVVDYLKSHISDLIVLATHQRKSDFGWSRQSIAEPIARSYNAPALFVPNGVPGFVSADDGSVKLSNVLIPVDSKPKAHKALDVVSKLVKSLGITDVEFTLLSVGDGNMPMLNPEEHADWKWHRMTTQGAVVKSILETANSIQADLIVMPTAGHNGFMDAVRGSTTEQVLRDTECPLLAVSSS